MKFSSLSLFTLLFATFGCQSAIQKKTREMKYSAYEIVGIQKRDLFKKEVKNVKEDQEETGEAFKDALERLKEVYDFDGGSLEKEYRALKSSHESAQERAQAVSKDIVKIETVAQDLFAEWRKEIASMESSTLRTKSQASLHEAEQRYATFHASLKKSEKKMAPALRMLNDQVLFLKHNLNAQAITGLKSESLKIEGNIESLLEDVKRSIEQANQFIETM